MDDFCFEYSLLNEKKQKHIKKCCLHQQWIDTVDFPLNFLFFHLVSISQSFHCKDIFQLSFTKEHSEEIETKYVTIITTVFKEDENFREYNFLSFSFFSEKDGSYKTQEKLIKKMETNYTINIHENDLIRENESDDFFLINDFNRKKMMFLHYKCIYSTIEDLCNFF